MLYEWITEVVKRRNKTLGMICQLTKELFKLFLKSIRAYMYELVDEIINIDYEELNTFEFPVGYRFGLCVKLRGTNMNSWSILKPTSTRFSVWGRALWETIPNMIHDAPFSTDTAEI